MHKKRIIFTVTNDLSYDQRMIRICTTLSDVYEVLLIGRQRPKSILLETRSFQQKRLSCFFQKGKLFYLEYNIRLFVFLLFTKCDGISAVDLDTILPVFLISKIRTKICFFDAHEYFTEVPEVVDRPLTKFIWGTLADFCIPRIAHCYTVCESLADIFTKEYHQKFEVIRNVPFLQTLEKEPSTIVNKRKILLYQGVLNEGRGIEALIEAVKSLEEVELWLAGEGDLSNELRQLVGEDYKDKIKFLGYQTPDELKKITAQADIGFNLLENKGKSYYYSLANKFFDYIQAGIPSINMNFPEYQKINDKYSVAVLIDDLKQEKIIQAIDSLCKNESLYQTLKQNCLIAKQELNWERETEKLVRIYSKAFS